MNPISSSSLLVLFLPIISLLDTTTVAFDALFTTCSGDNYTSPSPFDSNLRVLIANLISKTPISQFLLFYINFPIESSLDRVYGYAQCRLDASPTICADCLNLTATAAFNGSCAGRKSAFFRYDYCLLRYADHYFFSDPMNLNFTNHFNPESAIDLANFRTQLWNMLEELVVAAASNVMSFAVKETTYGPIITASKELYGLAWCTMTSPEDCYLCLNQAIEGYRECCLEQIGGWAATVSCVVAYDNQPFFNLSFLQVAPPPGGGDGNGADPESKIRNIFLISAMTALATLILFLLCVIIIYRKSQRISNLGIQEYMGTDEAFMLPFASLKVATNNFSNENKLGEGRFGPAYKGVLQDGRQVVVNRISKASQKGFSELNKEVDLVAQLQHKNLVKLFGHCLQSKEKLLVYEYLPNASLDEHLFDPARREKLDWKKRHAIVEGIARGLVYLHNHSRVRIIHRDLNAKNILLDENMNPKISDFGLAKLVSSSKSQLNTKLIAGTFGYMAPEYATRGFFSKKSDVFSYGMVVLEIVTGRRNCSFVEFGNSLNLQTFVWQLWYQGKAEEVIDQGLGGQYQKEEVMRCLNIGLLCVQADPVERPSMSTVMLYLSSNTCELPVASLPGFFTGEYPPSEYSKPSTSLGTNHDSPLSTL